MGLDAFIGMSSAIKMSRRMGSAPWLFPARPDLHFKSKNQNFQMVKLENFNINLHFLTFKLKDKKSR